MAKVTSICCAVLSVLLLAQFSVSVDSPAESPAPPPQTGADSPPPRSPSRISSPPAPSPRNAPVSSPPAPPPSDLPPSSSPSPSPSEASDISRNNVSKNDESDEESKNGMSGAQKFGIAIGVIAAVALIGFGGLVYKKRQDNIRRSRYGYTARRELL
ncbi:proline-rich receptor-like protein kinase PERK10 isoform X2 [Cucurbita maxima]|uniref:Proline-rich receptor-like protein kinase PERK10 isoform X2 n=1 Tax=Cucurbita maxima TaxID=3661 RepID=A0A6J1I5I8_CUCMA|nr:proline-rich receptor-like protein kinase PERK10 isoform X2 [Cucurbita maxima]